MSKEAFQESVPSDNSEPTLSNSYDRDEQATIGGYRENPPNVLAVIKLSRNDQKPNQQPQK